MQSVMVVIMTSFNLANVTSVNLDQKEQLQDPIDLAVTCVRQ